MWGSAPHNAFTDLEFDQGQWFCAFREGSRHAQKGNYGKVCILHSKEGESWESVGLLESQGLDLRDAKLSITPGGELLLNPVEYDADRQAPPLPHHQWPGLRTLGRPSQTSVRSKQ